jgi:peroxiredoxin
LVKVEAAYASADLRVLAINGIDQEQGRDDKHVKQFIEKYSVTFPVALDKGSRVLRAYGIPMLPAMVFIDSGGVVRAISVGQTSREALERGIATIIPPG